MLPDGGDGRNLVFNRKLTTLSNKIINQYDH